MGGGGQQAAVVLQDLQVQRETTPKVWEWDPGAWVGFRCFDRSCKGDEPLKPAARNGNLRDYNTRCLAQLFIGNELRGAPTEFLESGASQSTSTGSRGFGDIVGIGGRFSKASVAIQR